MRVGAPRLSGAGGWGDPGAAAGEVEERLQGRWRGGGPEAERVRFGVVPPVCAAAGLPALLDWWEADQFITSPQVEAQARSKL